MERRGGVEMGGGKGMEGGGMGVMMGKGGERDEFGEWEWVRKREGKDGEMVGLLGEMMMEKEGWERMV